MSIKAPWYEGEVLRHELPIGLTYSNIPELGEVELFWIASCFDLNPIENVRPFIDRGNINLQTYEVTAGNGEHYLLQRLNTSVFKRHERVMDAMTSWIQAQNQYLSEGRAPAWTVWEPVTLIPTTDGQSYLEVHDAYGRSVWRMMAKIRETTTYKSLSELPNHETRLRLAEEVGRGLALNADLSSLMPVDSLAPSLPGYRDTRGYYRQFRSVLAGNRTEAEAEAWLPDDADVREATLDSYLVHCETSEYLRRLNDPALQEWIDLCRLLEPDAMKLVNAVENGTIRRTPIHGDTKLDNFLFCRQTQQVRSLVDLDTIMSFTWLADWGDMMRSLCNVAGEKERDPSKVNVNEEVYEAVARGFLSTAREVQEAEVALMTDAIQIITLELGLRFLTDYLRGDNYFGLLDNDPRDLNKVRAIAQLTLFRRLCERDEWSRELIQRLRSEAKGN